MAEDMESCGCFEKYFGDETNLVQQIIFFHLHQRLAIAFLSSRLIIQGPSRHLYLDVPQIPQSQSAPYMKSSSSPPKWPSSHILDPSMAAASTHCQGLSLLCQTSHRHQVLFQLPYKISPSVLVSPFPPTSSRSGSHLLLLWLWHCPLQSIMHTAATLNTKHRRLKPSGSSLLPSWQNPTL